MTKRNSGIDLLRIFSMVGIVSLHVIGLEGGIDSLPSGSLANTIVRYIWIVSFISVDVFGILTGYLRKFDVKLNRGKCVAGFTGISVFILVWQLFCMHYFHGRLVNTWTNAYYSPFVIVMAALFFELFVNGFVTPLVKMGKGLKWAADGMFGVYIIHAHAQLWDKVIQPTISNQMKMLATQKIFVCVAEIVGMIAGIVVVALLLDKIREYLFKLCKFNKLEMRTAEYLDAHFPLT